MALNNEMNLSLGNVYNVLQRLTSSNCSIVSYRKQIYTISSGTVHTSAKARLTSAAIWRISMNECSLTTFDISQ